MLKHAIEIDLGYAKAHALVSLTYLRDLYMQLTDRIDDTGGYLLILNSNQV